MSHRVVASSGGGDLREEWGILESWGESSKAGGNLWETSRRRGNLLGTQAWWRSSYQSTWWTPPHLEIVNLWPITIFGFQYNKMVLFEEGEQCFCSIKSDTKETDSDFLGSGDFSTEATYYYFTCT